MNLYYRYTHIFFLSVLYVSSLFGQFERVDSINTVIIKPFTPPVNAVINDLLYSRAKIFYAPDIYSENHNLTEYLGKNVILWFSEKDCTICDDGLDVLSKLKEDHTENLVIFSFSNEGKTELIEKYKNKIPNFNVMYNSKIFGEMMYAGSLKYPRLFFINEEGYITKVIPAETLKNDVKFVINKLIDGFDEKR